MGEELFYGLALILAVVLVSVGVMRFLKQPNIIGYILAGTMISLLFPDLLHSNEALESFSHIGISFLLFMVGMELHPKIIKDLWKNALITGLLQIVLTTVFGFLLSWGMGFEPTTALFLGIGFSFSSTIVILKLLSDRGQTEETFGRLSIGILIVQDLVVMLAFFVLSMMGSVGEWGNIWWTIALSLGYFVVAIVALFALARWVIPYITKKIAKSTEFLFLFGIGWCFLLGSLFHTLGFGIEIGTLLAGISLATSDYRFEIMSRVKSLRDFFIVMFFVFLGSQVTISYSWKFFSSVLAFSLFVLLIKPLIVNIILGLRGYTRKNTFMSSISLGQISEFSFLLLTIGMGMGLISDPELVSIMTLVGLITITFSSYFIAYAEKLYFACKKYLGALPGKWHRNYNDGKKNESDIIIFGFGRFGNNLYDILKQNGNDVLVVDENPHVIDHLHKRQIPCLYWDASNIEFLEEIHIPNTKMVISTIRSYEDNLILLENFKSRKKELILVMIANHIEEAIQFYDLGADYVILPHYIGVNHTSLLLEEYGFDLDKFMNNKKTQLQVLRNRHKDLVVEALHKM